MRERVIERYLHTEVTRAGGTTRKMRGRKALPDRLVAWPGRAGCRSRPPLIHLVELKAPGGKPRADQVREHERLDALGHHVYVLNTLACVDAYVSKFK